MFFTQANDGGTPLLHAAAAGQREVVSFSKKLRLRAQLTPRCAGGLPSFTGVDAHSARDAETLHSAARRCDTAFAGLSSGGAT
jgi:hypothetical protein